MTGTGRALLRRMRWSDLDMVRDWRNHADIRRHMYSTREIGPEEHREWFERVSTDPAHHVMILEIDGVPTGYVNIGPVAADGSAKWGFYVAPGSSKGTGRQLGESAIAYCFDVIGLSRLRGEVVATNEASARFHLSLGFHQLAADAARAEEGAIVSGILQFELARTGRPAKGDHRGNDA